MHLGHRRAERRRSEFILDFENRRRARVQSRALRSGWRRTVWRLHVLEMVQTLRMDCRLDSPSSFEMLASLRSAVMALSLAETLVFVRRERSFPGVTNGGKDPFPPKRLWQLSDITAHRDRRNR